MWSASMSSHNRHLTHFCHITFTMSVCLWFVGSVRWSKSAALIKREYCVGIGLLSVTWHLFWREFIGWGAELTFIAHAPNASATYSGVENSDGVPSSFLTMLFSLQESPVEEGKRHVPVRFYFEIPLGCQKCPLLRRKFVQPMNSLLINVFFWCQKVWCIDHLLSSPVGGETHIKLDKLSSENMFKN